MNPRELAIILQFRLLMKVTVMVFLLDGLHAKSCCAARQDDAQHISSPNDCVWQSSVVTTTHSAFENDFRPVGWKPFAHVAQQAVTADRSSMFQSEASPVPGNQADSAALASTAVTYPNYVQWQPAPAWHSSFGSEVCRMTYRAKADVVCDFQNFFDRRNMLEFGVALGVAASFANSSIDEDFRSWIDRQGLSNRDVDCWYREIGNGAYVIPLVLGTNLAAHFWQCRHLEHNNHVAQYLDTWGYRSMRSIAVGAPTLIVTQWATGASRPGETPFDSEWKWFDDENGASGHAFIGAVPFLVAADMTDRPGVKGLLYVGSGLAGYSRICDDAHYLSQVILGWSIAHISVRATRMTDGCRDRFSLVPQNINGDPGLGITIRR